MTKRRSFQSQSNISTYKVICRNNWLLSYSEEDRNANHEMWFSVGVVVVFLRRRLLISSYVLAFVLLSSMWTMNGTYFVDSWCFLQQVTPVSMAMVLKKFFFISILQQHEKPLIIFPYFLKNVKGNGPTFWRTFQWNWSVLMSVIFLF